MPQLIPRIFAHCTDPIQQPNIAKGYKREETVKGSWVLDACVVIDRTF